MLIYYMNDEPNPIQVRIMDARYDPCEGKGDFYFTLNKAEGQTFEVLIPEGHTLYIKKWKGLVMLSTVSLSVAVNLGGVLPLRSPRPPQDEEPSDVGLFEE
jgi:hypothetical protein